MLYNPALSKYFDGACDNSSPQSPDHENVQGSELFSCP